MRRNGDFDRVEFRHLALTEMYLEPGATLVLGGARSGKSAFAETLIESRPGLLYYLATGQAFDDEMRTRIDHHQDRRGERWVTFEEPLDIIAVLEGLPRDGQPVLVDCLTLWLSNLMHAERDVTAETATLSQWLALTERPILLVSNEVGLGIVPENALARRFRDEAGRLHQAIARSVKAVYFVAAGLPLKMK